MSFTSKIVFLHCISNFTEIQKLGTLSTSKKNVHVNYKIQIIPTKESRSSL